MLERASSMHYCDMSFTILWLLNDRDFILSYFGPNYDLLNWTPRGSFQLAYDLIILDVSTAFYRT